MLPRMKNQKARLLYPNPEYKAKAAIKAGDDYTKYIPYQFQIHTDDHSKEYRTHTTIHAERLHKVAETIMYPLRWNGQLLARVVQPSPGENKGSILRDTAIRFFATIGAIILIPFSIVSAIIGFPLRAIAHLYRPAASVMITAKQNDKYTAAKPELSETKPLHIRTHNLGLVTSTMSIIGDLRDVNERAKEVVKRIKNDTKKPDVICFQESFHEDATRTLCNGLKNEYPYIVHNVAPCISGFNSGSMIFSKYPILSADFERFQGMLGPERFSPRGMTKITLQTNKGLMNIYSIHTQALIGHERAQARLAQLNRVKVVMDTDKKNNPALHQVLVGDFNTSAVTAWGENNLSPKGQAEEPVLNYLKDNFIDPFNEDHDYLTGKRKDNTEAYFLDADRAALNARRIKEPSATWSHGPFADKGAILKRKMDNDRKKNKQPAPDAKIDGIEVKKPTWGTKEWQNDQTANTARLDYVLFPAENPTLTGKVEIRNIGGNEQSASTDHLPVDARIWVKK